MGVVTRHPSPRRQTCRVRGCKEQPDLHTVVDVDFQGDARAETVSLGLDLCSQHMNELFDADNEDTVFVAFRRQVRAWEPFEWHERSE